MAVDVTVRLDRFRDFIREHGLKNTHQREEIARWFLGVKGHFSAEQIFAKVREIEPGIGFSTVYRTMRLLCEAGLVQERHFDQGEALYENLSAHHDHCICTECGRIEEFENDQIESLQLAAARRLGFLLVSHRLELYGLCRNCR